MKKKTGNRGAVMTELKTLALLSGGLLLGNMGGKAIDKLLKVDSTVPGMQLKKLARPLLLLGTGVAGAMRLKDGNLRMLSAGVGASGLLGTVETLTGKDLLSGVPLAVGSSLHLRMGGARFLMSNLPRLKRLWW
jgi:hypothetical protein